MDVITYSMLGLKLIHVSKRGHRECFTESLTAAPPGGNAVYMSSPLSSSTLKPFSETAATTRANDVDEHTCGVEIVSIITKN